MKQRRTVPDGSLLQKLRRGLLPFSLQHKPETPDDDLNYYLDAYDINFQDEFAAVFYTGGYLQTEQHRIFCQLWQQERHQEGPHKNNKGTVFILHGYYDHTGLYGHLIRFFLQQGYSVFAFDEPGHGLSDGTPASIDNFSTYTSIVRTCMDWALENDLPQPFHLAGQSMGGAIITELLVGEKCSRQEYPIDKVILFAPLIRPAGWRWGKIRYQLAGRFLKQIPRSRSRNSNDNDFLTFLQTEPLQNKTLSMAWVGALSQWIDKIEAVTEPCEYDVLIVQGERDGTVDWQHNMSVYPRLYKSADIYLIPDGQHHLVNEHEDIRQQYFGWLTEKLG